MGMKMSRSLVLTALAVVLLGSERPPSSEEQARKILETAVVNLGGRERLSSLDNWLVEGHGRENLSAELQGLSPDVPTWRPHEEKVGVVRKSGAVAWERKTPRNDQSLRWRRFIHKPDASGVVDWTTRRGSMRPSGTPAARREALMRRIPHLLVLEALSARTVRLGERQIGGAPHDVVAMTLAGGEKLVLLFSREPVVLRRVEFMVDIPGLGESVVGWQWQSWQADARLGFVPAGHAVDVGGVPFQEVAYTRYEAGTPDAAALLEIPAELRQASPGMGETAPPPAGPATGEVAPGVHVASLRGFVVMLVAFRDFVVAVEAPETHPGLEAIPAAGTAGPVSREHRELLQRTFPGKPVRYLILSHHHGDHLGGARPFAEAGAILLTAPGDAAAARRAVSPIDVRIETVADRRVITDGSRKLEVINIGTNPHTAENLLTWLPEERLLFQGDLFYYSEGAPFPPSGRGIMNRFFADWLRTHGIEPKAVYGVHSDAPAGPDALARAAMGN